MFSASKRKGSRGAHTVYIVDVFTDAAGRDAHYKDAAAAQIMATVPPYLASPPDISPLKLVVAKGVK